MDYVPTKRTERKEWYENMSDHVVDEAAKFHGAPADALDVKAKVDSIIAKFKATDDAQVALDGARLIEHATEAADLVLLRAKIKNWKTLPDFPGSGSEGVLQLHGASSGFDPHTYKPVFKASLVTGGVRLDFFKKGADAMRFKMRLQGAVNWTKLGENTTSPFTDTTPLTTPGVAETREYMAHGLLHGEEIGLDSEVVLVVFAG